jgi:hypothetical protein
VQSLSLQCRTLPHAVSRLSNAHSAAKGYLLPAKDWIILPQPRVVGDAPKCPIEGLAGVSKEVDLPGAKEFSLPLRVPLMDESGRNLVIYHEAPQMSGWRLLWTSIVSRLWIALYLFAGYTHRHHRGPPIVRPDTSVMCKIYICACAGFA